MSPEEIRELWSRFLQGETLSAEAQKELVQALDADSELRDSLIDNLQLDGMLRALDTTRKHGEAFVRTMTECVGAEHDATRFIEKVELRLNEPQPPAPEAAGTARRSKPPTTRVFRRRSAAPSQGETAWKPALIAAAALVVILLLVTKPKPAQPTKPQPPVAELPGPRTNPDPAPPRPEAPQPETPKSNDPLRPPVFPPVTPERKPEDPPTRPENPSKTPETPKSENPKPKTEVLPPKIIVQVPATLEKVEKFVFCGPNNANMSAAGKGDKVPAGHEVRTKAASMATVVYDDLTWVELAPNSSLREEPALPGEQRGRRVVLNYGALESHITKQNPDLPMVFATSTAEARIVGTTIRLTVMHDPKGSTILEVKEGKVIFTRLLDKRPVEVVTGQFAVVADGTDLKAAKSFPDEIIVKFGPADLQRKEGWLIDSGAPFDAARGYGWDGRKDGEPMPGVFWKDPQDGKTKQRYYGRGTTRRTSAPDVDPLKQTDVNAGWAGYSETWMMPVPNGKYEVKVCCGDIGFDQGPHHVVVEDVPVINMTPNKPGKFIENVAIVEVKDGWLTMKVGGFPGNKVSSDKSSDTIINYLSIKRIRK
jgi:hypothetical protein